ncbi:MAG: ComEC/Rec2 family competence protein [Planctomycetota bacterium]|jgi:competence protein ComEC
MPVSLAHRPLAVAGPAVVAGALLHHGLGPPAWLVLAPCAVLAALRRDALVLAVLAALAAGLAADRRASLRSSAAPTRAPPELGRCVLEVTRSGHDPVRGRAWIEGRTPGGAGVLCLWPGEAVPGAGPGARVAVRARFRLPPTAANPGEQDARERLARRGVTLFADLRSAGNVDVLRAGGAGPLERARRAAAARLRATLPADAAPLACALLLGYRSGLSAEDRALFGRTGTLHVLAISGLHVMLLVGAVHALLKVCGLGPRSAAACSLALALLYVPLTGGAAPIRRAVTMLVFYGIALVRGRPPDAASALGGAAALLAIADPLDVRRIGFHLSFAAAAGIALLAGPWQHRWSRRHRLLARFPAVRADRPLRLRLAAYLLSALPVSLAAWCATAALVAHAFGVVTPLAPLANVAAGPFLVLAVPSIALLALGLPLASVVAWSLGGLKTTLIAIAQLPVGPVPVPAPPLAAVALWLAGVVVLRWRPAAGLMLLAGAAVWALARPPPSATALHLLDVGHGQAAIVRLGPRTVLVDAGSRGRLDLARRTVWPALRSLGVRRLDAVVCTHADADHWNALPDLFAIVPVGALLVGGELPPALRRAAAEHDVEIRRLRDGDTVAAGGNARLVVLQSGGIGTRNDRSVALALESGAGRVLLPADREDAGLAALLAPRLGRCDVLVAPHHGGRCRLASAFGAATRPRWLIVSSTARFAHRPTLRAYGAREIRGTWRDGCTTVDLSGDRIAVRGFR